MNNSKLILTLLIYIILGVSLSASEFKSKVRLFLNKYCISCHDNEVQKGGIALHKLNDVKVENVELWKQIWEQVALNEMPPRKKKNQPALIKRLEISNLITSRLSEVLASKGGFTEHSKPVKGNHLNHDLIFNTSHKNLQPTSTSARIWRIHPQEHLVRIKQLVTKGRPYDPKQPGVRTRGDHIPSNLLGEVKVYLGLDRVIGHVGGLGAYSLSVGGFPKILNTIKDHGLKNYPFLYTVNSSESSQILSMAEEVLRFMAYGPKAERYQFADKLKNIPAKHRNKINQGSPNAIFYNNKIERPLTPVYYLMKEKGVSEKRLEECVKYLFEALTLRPPNNSEIFKYKEVAKKTIIDLGKNEGALLGLAPIFLDRDALFRPELVNYGKPDKYGRVMLQQNELMLAVNGAFSYIRPDDKLVEALHKGKLKTRSDVKREVIRILNDDKIRKPRILQFFKEYFDYDLCISICKDTNALKKAGGRTGFEHYHGMNTIVANTDRLIELILTEDKNVLKEILTTDKVILDMEKDALFYIDKDSKVPKEYSKIKSPKVRFRAMAKYGEDVLRTILTGPSKPIFARTSEFHRGKDIPKELNAFPKNQRMGILTHPSWLISHSDAMDNHVILRGRWIRERLLGDAVPDVPITVDAMLPNEPHSTLRHRMRVTREKECWRCHQKMDPLGLPFEMYNHLGMLRTKENGKPVDASGEIVFSGAKTLDGKVSNAFYMIKKLANSERVEQVFIRHAFRYWMGRNETINDAPVLKAAHKAYRENGGSMKALLTSLLTSDAFLYRKVTVK